MAQSSLLYIFMVIMLITGTINMVLLKYQHMQMAPMSPGGSDEHFAHPWLQAGFMMCGEFLCLLVYLCTRSQEERELSTQVPKLVFLVPCCCDLVATALLCMGIGLIAVSIAQMCRGTIVLFVCAMSVVFLGRRQHAFHIVGVIFVIVGITVVSMSALVNSETGELKSMPGHMAAGISLCICAQIFQASMFVYEEKIMSKYPVRPLQVVGMEGAFGIAISLVLLLVLHILGYANTPGALYQIRSSFPLAASIVGSMLAVAVFNFSGATVTQQSSAVARTTIKMSSTIMIWVVELSLGWNTFSFLQLFGFAFVAAGTVLYNRMVVVRFLEPNEEAASIREKGKVEELA